MTESNNSSLEPVVPCLMGITQLQSIMDNQGVKLGDSTRKFLVHLLLKKLGPHHVQKLISKLQKEGLIKWEDDLYEVDYILDHCEDEDTGNMYYLIKWEGWASEYNSWEPRSHLQCDDIIDTYMDRVEKGQKGVKRKYKDIVNCGMQSKSVVLEELLEKVSSSEEMCAMSPMDILQLYSPAKKVKKIEPLLGLRKSLPHFRTCTAIKSNGGKFNKRLKKADIAEALKEWEKDLNKIIRGVDSAPITVVNDVDLEGPPDTFVYINQCKEGPGVTIPKDPPIGCECEDCFNSKTTCCAACSGTDFAYYKNKRIRLQPGRPVYECNSRCKCGPDCINRVVQNGRKFKISIFRTKNSRGWGVKTLQRIKKGSFVMEYVGEVITHEEAERRGQAYDAAGRTYLFDLDFADSNTSYTVDAGVYGNAAHFINHSCDPNMEVYCVWVNCLDPKLPHICLFAKRDIAKDEELSFDYLCAHANREDCEVSFNEPPPPPPPAPAPPATPPAVSSTTSPSKPAQPAVEEGQLETEDNVAVGETGDGFSLKGIAISPKEKSSSVAVSSYSTICQCGAANCRKYLF